MNKTAIKNFAVWARRKLISEITYKAGLIGINEKGISQPLSISTGNIQFFDIGTGKPNEIADHEIKQRNALVKRIREKESTSDYKTAFQFVIEEVSYTWFNRLIAIRFMEVNDYLPSRIRVLSSETPAKSEPDMVTTPFDTDMEFSAYETDRIMQLKHENKLDELFRMLFIKQCNKLNGVLPELFEKTADYTELLLTISFTDSDGIVSHLVNDIEEEDFTEAVEIIGWMYQYYNTEPKSEVFALLKEKIKITKERIPAATQLFTPDWIVRYMVENSLGRLWYEGHPNDNLKSEWKYYIDETEQEEIVKKELEKIRKEYTDFSLEEIKFIDPCMGSGHILVYAFDVLMQIYQSQGYTQRDAASAIVENNLYGLDIDDRAYQLTYFAVMMKARKYDRRFLMRGCTPKLFSIKESNDINKSHLQYFGHSLIQKERNIVVQQMECLLDSFYDAKEYGSILNIDNCNWELLRYFIEDFQIRGQISLESIDAEDSQEKLREIIAIGEAMAQKYDVVVTNPPYMGSSGMGLKLSKYVKKFFPDSKSDFFSVFIERCAKYTKINGYYSMITQPSFLALSSFEKLREKMFGNCSIASLLHMGRGIFGIDFGSTSFTIRNNYIENYKGHYFKLHKKTFQFIEPADIEKLFLVSKNNPWILCDFDKYDTKEGISSGMLNSGSRLHYVSKQDNFKNVPGLPFSYWVSEAIIKPFVNPALGTVLTTREGMATAGNDRFLRNWFEIPINEILFNCNNSVEALQSGYKWFPYNKGGDYRKWYGNNELVVNWYNDGFEIRNNIDLETGRIRSHNYNGSFGFREGITWSSISAGDISVRYSDSGFLFDSKGAKGFCDDSQKLLFIQALLNSKVSKEYLKIFSPTMDFKVGDIILIPLYHEIFDNEKIQNFSSELVSTSRIDWDSSETSWDFLKHPLLNGTTIEKAFTNWQKDCTLRFTKVKSNEEKINSILIDIYGLQDELSPDVDEKAITIRKADVQMDAKSFISYAVGCMFGRYSIDENGLSFAGGGWDENKYTTFTPDKDNCILITDEEYFGDDIVGRFTDFVKCAYGEETFEENLDFIAKAIGNKGNTSREIIRNYFIKDFYKDHTQTYQKRPIYWLYDSGKQEGFKALVYMHRYTADTTGVVRVDYLHKMQKIYMSEIERMNDMAENSTNAREVAQAEKRKEKLVKQLKETKEYDEKIAHLAISRIAIDLDDGVKVNYEKVQTGQDGNKLSILAKI